MVPNINLFHSLKLGPQSKESANFFNKGWDQDCRFVPQVSQLIQRQGTCGRKAGRQAKIGFPSFHVPLLDTEASSLIRRLIINTGRCRLPREEGGLLVTAGGLRMERSLTPLFLLWNAHSVADTDNKQLGAERAKRFDPLIRSNSLRGIQYGFCIGGSVHLGSLESLVVTRCA